MRSIEVLNEFPDCVWLLPIVPHGGSGLGVWLNSKAANAFAYFRMLPLVAKRIGQRVDYSNIVGIRHDLSDMAGRVLRSIIAIW